MMYYWLTVEMVGHTRYEAAGQKVYAEIVIELSDIEVNKLWGHTCLQNCKLAWGKARDSNRKYQTNKYTMRMAPKLNRNPQLVSYLHYVTNHGQWSKASWSIHTLSGPPWYVIIPFWHLTDTTRFTHSMLKDMWLHVKYIYTG